MVWDVDLRHKWNRKSGRAHCECLPPVLFFWVLLEKWGKATSRHCATFLWSYKHISKQLNKIYFFIDSYTLENKISLQSMTYTPIPGQCPHQQWVRGPAASSPRPPKCLGDTRCGSGNAAMSLIMLLCFCWELLVVKRSQREPAH